MGARVRFLTKRGKWQGSATHRGRRVCKNFSRNQREQALTWASDTFAAMALGKPIESVGRGPMSLSRFAVIYINNFSTNRSDRDNLNSVIAMYGTRRIDSIAEWHVRRYIADRRAAGKSNKTINHSVAALRHVIYTAVREGYLPARPEIGWHALMLPTQPRDRVWTEEQIAALRAVLPRWLHDPFDLALLTGLRFGDLTNITEKQIDAERRCLVVTQRKNARPLTIPLTDEAMAIINRNRANIARVGVLLVNSEGTPLRDFQRAWDVARRRAGIRGLTWHDLRHTFATRLVHAGAPRDVLAAMLGDTPQVAAMYATVSLNHKREYLEKVGRRMVAENRAIEGNREQSNEG